MNDVDAKIREDLIDSHDIYTTENAINVELDSALLETNLDEFTLFILKYPERLTNRLIDEYFVLYGSKYKDANTYYYTLRILDLLLMKDFRNFGLFDKEYLDEQFIRKSYSIDSKIDLYLSTFQKKVYLYDDFIATNIRSLIRSWKFFKASIF